MNGTNPIIVTLIIVVLIEVICFVQDKLFHKSKKSE
jgi:hypothetical protein